MEGLYLGKYRMDSARAAWWDYSEPGCYVITTCTKNRIPYFGSVIDKEMQLSTIGSLVRNEWLKTPGFRPEMEIVLDRFQIMPDHFHGILFFGLDETIDKNKPDRLAEFLNTTKNKIRIAQQSELKTINVFGPQSQNLGSIVRGFKSAVTVAERKADPSFAWQSLFYDRIVRSFEELENWRRYIELNPKNWQP